MCEFKVILKGKEVFRDAVYAKAKNGTVTVRDVIGESKEFRSCKIVEVDVSKTKLVLSPA
jgi:predicted RNA-binding protein